MLSFWSIVCSQTLEPSEEDQLLIVKEECQEVLKEKCPLEFVDTEEKDVSEMCELHGLGPSGTLSHYCTYGNQLPCCIMGS